MGTDSFAQLRIVSYNTATSGENFSGSQPRPTTATVLEAIGAETVNGVAKPIDVLLLQEQSSVDVTTQAFVDIMNDIYGEGTYAHGRVDGGTNGGGRAGIVYNTQTVDLIAERALGQLSSTAQARRTMRYQLRPVGYDERSDFFAYVNHYKASTGATNELRRNVEATALRRDADAFGEGVNAIYAGDYNIQSCSEDMFQTLTATGPGQAIDPLADFATGCDWHNNNDFRELHTQSPSDGTSAGLVEGGLDDRFDFQLVTNNLIDEEGLSLIPGSYHAFGNNGTHRLNQPINSSSNTAASQIVLDALAQASDHLPVVADYQLPAIMQVELGEIPNRVILGTRLQLDVRVSNVAPVAQPIGADELDFDLRLDTIGLPANIQSGNVAAASTAESMQFELPTNLATVFGFGIGATAQSQGAMNGDFFEPGSYTVVSPSVGSLAQDDTRTSRTIDLGIVPISQSPETQSFSIYNLASAGSAAMDLNAIAWSNDSIEFTSDLETFSDLLPGSEQDFVVEIDTSVPGPLDNTLTLTIADEAAIFGATESQLSIDFAVRAAIHGDANLDDEVGFDDFLILSANFGLQDTNWTSGDFNADNTSSFADFLLLSENFGATAMIATVPEPDTSTLAVLLASLLAVRIRKRAGAKMPRPMF